MHKSSEDVSLYLYICSIFVYAIALSFDILTFWNLIPGEWWPLANQLDLKHHRQVALNNDLIRCGKPRQKQRIDNYKKRVHVKTAKL